MNKLILAITLVATAAAIVPANAAPRNAVANVPMFASSTIQAGDQCFKPTDSSRGFGYWTSCDNVYTFALGRVGKGRSLNLEVQSQIERGADGGGGDGGSGGSGGQR